MTLPKPQAQPSVGTYWRFAVSHRPGMFDAEAKRLQEDVKDLGISGVEGIRIASIYYVSGLLDTEKLKGIGEELLIDPITQEYEVSPLTLPSPPLGERGEVRGHTVEVAYHPGVRDPVEDSLKKGALDLGIAGLMEVHTAKEYTISGSFDPEDLNRIADKLLVNATIQQRVTPENRKILLSPAPESSFSIETVHLTQATDTVLQRVSMDHQLSLTLEEMRVIQAHFRQVGREPTLIELETIAQTWSEHCKHKTFLAPIVYTEEVAGKSQKRVIQGLLKSTIMRSTEELARPWCVSVFKDNAGVIEFDETSCVTFKVETHNHPSALEPFGGASTGIGGVIRDTLGTGLGAKPVASTDVFCFAPPDLPEDRIPSGVLHPRRVIKGVVSGVKDYGNKMGIPTVNGAVLFDERFLGNPLVYCGNVGLLPKGKIEKRVSPGMRIVLAGGLTGRDGVHGATFSSIGLTAESEGTFSAAVQIGDPITEKKLLDALLMARDQGLFSAVTDCGAGGLSSAVGEMGASCGARVHLEKVPLKYKGLTPTEIWISESQERMVLAVPPEKENLLTQLFKRQGVEAISVGEFTGTGRLELFYQGTPVGELSMQFLHEGVPLPARPARWVSPKVSEPNLPVLQDHTQTLLSLLSRWETCSKEWIIRQYDHEVQGGSVLKPLAGGRQQGPSDAAVVRPRLDSLRGIVLANGINFRYGDLDPYWMALLNVEEAIRQVIAVGGTLNHLALLDNFCWGDPTRPHLLGGLVRAAYGCRDAAKAFGTPFISGKDSLYNEFRGGDETVQIPGTLLISAIGIIPDVAKTLSMDAKSPHNRLYLIGVTKAELGGSSYYGLHGFLGACVPRVDLKSAPSLMRALSQAIAQGLIASVHDCSEGGFGVAAAEMSFAGNCGLMLDLKEVPQEGDIDREDWLLFSESPTRFLCEVAPEKEEAFAKAMEGFPIGKVGQFQEEPFFRVIGLGGKPSIETTIQALREAWERPFRGW